MVMELLCPAVAGGGAQKAWRYPPMIQDNLGFMFIAIGSDSYDDFVLT